MPNEVEITIRAVDMTGPAFVGVMAKMAALRTMARGLGDDLKGIVLPELDTSLLESSLVNLRSKLQSLGIADLADINVQPGRIMVQLQLIKRLINQAGISDVLDFNVNPGTLAAQLAKIHGLSETIPVTFDTSKIPVMGPIQNISDKYSIQGLDIAAQQLDQAKMQTDLFSQALAHLQSEKDALIEDINLGLIPALGKQKDSTAAAAAATTVGARAFYGWGGILAGSIGGIGLWHLALDGVLESTIALGSAAAALTIGIAAMVPTAQDIYTHLQAVSAVNSALGSQIPPLTGQFDALATAMAPQTIEAYGGALNLVNTNSSLLAKIAPQVVTGIDDWIAKLDLWSHSQTGMGVILQNGMGFLHQFEGIVNEVGVALANLIKADPGTAHFLLDVVGGAGKLLDVVTSIPTPLLAAGIALHSFMVWGGAAIGVLSKLPGPIGAAGKAATEAGGHFGAAAGALRLMATSPWGWAAAGAAALGYLAYEGTQADSAIKGFVANMDAGLANEKASQAIGQITVDIGTLNSKMQALNSSSFTSMGISFSTVGYQMVGTWDALQKAASSFGSPGFWGSLGHLIEAPFTTGAASTVEYQNDINLLNSELDKLVGHQGNLFHETGVLITQGYSYSQSLALMDMAGVKAGDSFALMQQKVANLITGYQNLVAQGGMLNNAVNAVTFASELQSSKVSTLNQGWDTFMSTITGGASAFISFAQQTIGLYQSLTGSGMKLSDSNGKVSSSLALLASSAGGTKISMTGLNSASLLAQQTFIQSASSANSQMDALTTLASAAGLGTQGTDLLTQANKDLVSALLPAAGQSQTMTTILYALAQRGGYTGADSFQALSKWVGNTASPMTNLQGIVGTLTQAAGNLTTDVQNLSTALGTTLNDAMATAIFDASGGQKTFDNFATAILTTGVNSSQTHNAADSLASGLYALTGNVGSAQSEFETFAQKGLGLTKSQADTLWQSTLPKLQQTIDGLHGKAVSITVPNAPNAKQQVLDLNNSIIHLQNHTSIVRVVGEGGGGVSVTAPGLPAGIIALHSISGAASGMMVKGGIPGRDSVLIAAQQGEVVVPTNLVQAGAIDNLRGKIPGFSLGGMVGSTSTAVASDSSRIMENDTASVMRSMYAAVIAAEARAAAASAAQFVATQGASGGIIQSMMVNMAAARGWTGAQATALLEVEAREAGFNMTATNPTSGAYGLAQFINGPSEYAQYGGNATTASGQITGMLNYIAQRYGNPENAWAHELAYGWYDNGGILKPGFTMAYNGTGQNEYVSRGSQETHITLELGDSFRQTGLTEQQLEDIRYTVRVKGGGNAQAAFGRNK